MVASCICLPGDPCDYHACTCIVCPGGKCQGHPNSGPTLRQRVEAIRAVWAFLRSFGDK